MRIASTCFGYGRYRSHGALRNQFEKHNQCSGGRKKAGRPARSKRLLYAARAIDDPALLLIVGSKTPNHEHNAKGFERSTGASTYAEWQFASSSPPLHDSTVFLVLDMTEGKAETTIHSSSACFDIGYLSACFRRPRHHNSQSRFWRRRSRH